MKLTRTIGSVTTEYQLKERVTLPRTKLADGKVLRSVDVDVVHTPRRWLFTPHLGDGSARTPSSLCAPGIAEIK